jgi:hypothetical protein
MKKLIVTLALASLLGTPAFEAFAREQGRTAATPHHGARAAFAQDRGAAFAQDPITARRFTQDPAVVVVNGRVIGRDPDPNIRFELMRDADLSEY